MPWPQGATDITDALPHHHQNRKILLHPRLFLTTCPLPHFHHPHTHNTSFIHNHLTHPTLSPSRSCISASPRLQSPSKMRRLLLSSIPRRSSSSSNTQLDQQKLLQPLSILARHAQGKTITTVTSSNTSTIQTSRPSVQHYEHSTILPLFPRPQSRAVTRHFSSSAPKTPPPPQSDGGFATERDYHLAADEALDEVQFMVEGLEDTIEDFEANLSVCMCMCMCLCMYECRRGNVHRPCR